VSEEVSDNYDDGDALDEDMSAEDIEAMQLSYERLYLHYNGGELNHLTDEELRLLINSARVRDLQKTIIR
jgi:hypothetical protein